MSRQTKTFLLSISFLFFCFAGKAFAEGEGYSLLAPIPTITGTTQPDLVTYMKGLFTLFAGLSIVFAVVQIIIGGTQYTLAAVPSVKSSAKGKMTNAVLGLFIVLISSILLNTLNPGLLRIGLNLAKVQFDNSDLTNPNPEPEPTLNPNKKWTVCYTAIATCTETCSSVPPETTITPEVECQSNKSNRPTQKCSNLSQGGAECISKDCGSEVKTPPPTCTSGGKFTYDTGISAQIGSASSELASLISCMETRVPKGVGRISSISDSQVISGAHTWQYCAQNGCAHTNYSCHYGGHNCIGKSYAVDFGDEENMTQLKSAAKSCNNGAWLNNEGNHLHISVGLVAGCGCN